MRHPAVIRHESVRRVFGCDAALNRESVRRNGLLRGKPDEGVSKRHALSNHDLRLDDVDSRYLLRHRVLNLNPRVDFDEVELVCVGIDEKFDRAGIFVIHFATDGECRVAQRQSDVRSKIRGRSDLDHFLVPSLHRAVPLVKMHEVSVRVAQNLHFNMAGTLNEFFHKDIGTAEHCERFLSRLFECGFELIRLTDDTHPSSATAVSGLQDDGVTDFRGQSLSLLRVANRTAATTQDRHARPFSDLAC